MKEPPAGAAALVGRQRELSDARTGLEAALVGTGGLLLITGEAGIGKTRFVEALTSQLPARTLWGACWDDPGTPAFWPWTIVLRDCAAVFGLEAGDDLAPILGSAGSSDGPAQQLRLRLFGGVASMLSEAAAFEPLVIVFEDLHFADEDTLDLLRFVATALRGKPVAIVGTHRYPDLLPGAPLEEALADLGRAARSTALYGLSEDDIAELIRATTGTMPSVRLTARLRDRTGGNPLFVIEVAKLLAATGNLEADHIPVPASVQQVIAHRLSYIGSDTLDVLALASVVGQVFPQSVLAGATGEPPGTIANLLDGAMEAGLVRSSTTFGQVEFTHALVRDALYAGIPAAQRRTQHRLVAEAIEVLHGHDLDDHVDDLADHYVLALPDADVPKALDYTRRAGNRALGMLAYERAGRHFERAVGLADPAVVDQSHRVELLLALGDARLRAGDWEAASGAYEEVAVSARRRQRPDELARAALGFGAGLSGFEVRLFDQRQLDLLREALDGLGDGEPELRAWLLARLSVAESFLVPEEVRRAHSEEALVLAREADDPKLLTYALSSYCDTIPGPAHTEQRLELADEMVRLGIAANDAESELLGRRFRVVALLEAGDITGVDAEIEAFALTASRLRWPLVEWYPLMWRGMRALVEGRLDDADRLATKAREVGRRGGSVNAELAVGTGLQIYVQVERGRPDEVYEEFEWMLDEPEAGPNTEAALPLLLARMGRHAEARAILDRLAATGFPLVVDASWLDVIGYAVEGCAEVRHVEAAGVLLPLIEPFADRFVQGATGGTCSGSLNRHLGLLAQCLGQWDGADAYFRRALTANRRAGATLMVAHTLRQHAGMLQERDDPGDRTQADTMLAEANETYRQLGLEHWMTKPDDGRPAPETEHRVFRRDGETWVLRYADLETRVRNVKGLGVLARLLGAPGRELHVLDLVGEGDREERFAASADTGEVIDARARQAYKLRLSELEAEIDQAAQLGDIGRAERAQGERDALVEQLTAAYGLGGRVRRDNDPIERARSTVTKQIRSAIARIEKEHPSLALHLTNSITTGRYCSYTPEHPTSWDL